ncbi:MAG TPA: helix-turn-helix transcriptional regulator [Acidimicrobiales bacterium]|nr:helix-turn-helix transcriptional regulator [Acidimicrobiales bacterium]
MTTEQERSSTSNPYRVYGATSLGAALRHFRKEAGLTQQELADLTGLQRSYLSELEVGKETEQVRRLFQLLRQLGVRISLDRAEW